MASDYPPPLIIPPQSLPHTHTFILLHGRGSSGETFGRVLLDTPISDDSKTSTSPSPTGTPLTLATAFPHARFVFPTAARRRATIYRRSYTHQWFDNWKLDPPATDREELQIAGLRETVGYLHDLLRAEMAIVPGGANIIFGGLSQGCAASLIALLLWEGEALGAAVGMCGWLPFQVWLNEQASVEEADCAAGLISEEEIFDPFETDSNNDAVLDPPSRAIGWLRDELNFPASSGSSVSSTRQRVPLFLGHGVLDDRVSVTLGRNSAKCLSNLELRTCWKEYDGLGHWYSGDMLRDLVSFLGENIK